MMIMVMVVVIIIIVIRRIAGACCASIFKRRSLYNFILAGVATFPLRFPFLSLPLSWFLSLSQYVSLSLSSSLALSLANALTDFVIISAAIYGMAIRRPPI